MSRPGSLTWTWTLCVLCSWICVDPAAARPHYMVTFPGVLEAGADTQFCASLMQPNETLVMTVTLRSVSENITLLKRSASTDFYSCTTFKVPLAGNEEVQKLSVDVQGDTFHSEEVRKVMIKIYRPMTFVQTDKPIYIPGQTVQFRVVSMDSKMRPINELYNIIEVEDARNNRVAQWLNETSNSKILQHSYDLNSEAGEGTYRITVSVGTRKIYHTFKVERYVLPKFDVKLNASDEVSIDQATVNVEVCATYTYGQPVPGDVMLSLCRPINHYVVPTFVVTPEHPEGVPDVVAPCHVQTKQTDKNGCATYTVPMSTFTTMAQKALQDKLRLSVSVVEEGTGVSRVQEKNIDISYVIGKLSFIDTPKIYNEGSNVEGKVKAVHYNDTPVANMDVYVLEGERWSARLLHNLTTNSDGVATFSLSTDEHHGEIHLHVSSEPNLDYPGYRLPYFETKDHRMSLVQPSTPHTQTVSYLEVQKRDGDLPCDREEEISIHYTVVGEAQGSVEVMYLVLARAAIVGSGHHKVNVESDRVNEGEVSVKLTVTPDMASFVQIVAYAVLPSEQVIAHSADFNTEKCFNTKVSLEFSPSSALPGGTTSLKVTTAPDALCGVSLVDQSVLIKEPGKTLDADKIFDLLPVKRSNYIPYAATDSVPCLRVRPRRYVLPYPHHDKTDAHTVFENVGMKMATNLVIKTPSCLEFKGREYYYERHNIGYRLHSPGGGLAMSPPVMMDISARGGVGGGYYEPPPIVTVRTFFPETWLFSLVEVGASGSTDMPLDVPDTITTWETEAFCLSSQGLGLAPREEVTVFQPFFLELTMPYSIIRGENFELKATVFNYMSSCIMIIVTPADSEDYSLTPLSGDQYKSCLCGNQRKTLSWTMDAKVLGEVDVKVTAEAVASHASCDNEIVSVPARGRIDSVTRPLVVKAEGTEMTETYNWLLCPKGETLKEEVNIELPQNVIQGSAHAKLSVLGDILGRAMNNLDGLLQMPYGCGEQNMALLAPNIYILQYLENTNQLTPAIREKASKFLSSGYQRQLNYKHHDGAYSTFGSGSGNTWLTAFVLRSFTKARDFVFIDPAKIEESRTWLESLQQENGCFLKLGNLFNNRMKGGVSDEVTLSAYITAAFLEMNSSTDNPVVKTSLESCLGGHVNNFTNTYTTALLAYVYTLAGDTETRALLLKHLDSVASQEGGFLHWSQNAGAKSDSLSVEISSYVLLAKLSHAPTAEDLGYAARIVRWLTRQQNYYGGFSSTQDTVVALQALALYSTLVFSPEGSSAVSVQTPSGRLAFDVNQNNKLLYQEKVLQDTSGKFSLDVTGTACAVMQISLRYNVPTPVDDSTLSVSVTTEADCTGKNPKLSLRFQSEYHGNEDKTNMVILDIKMLSGYVPDEESLKRLKSALLVDRVDTKDDHVLVYLREVVPNIPLFHTLEITQQVLVKNLKPAVVKIYDYYQPSDHDDTEYTHPCVAG